MAVFYSNVQLYGKQPVDMYVTDDDFLQLQHILRLAAFGNTAAKIAWKLDTQKFSVRVA